MTNILRIALACSLIGLVLVASTAPFVFGAENEDPKSSGFQLVPDCEPSAFPKDTGNNPCDLSKLQLLIVKMIKFLLYIIFPIAFVILAWAGFIILTSAGSSEKVSQAYGMIKIAVTGIVLAAISYLTVRTIFNMLGAAADTYIKER